MLLSTGLKLGYSRIHEDVLDTELEIDFDTDEDPAEFEGQRIRRDIRDREYFVALDHKVPLAAGIDLVFGGYLQDKSRDTDISESEDEFELSPAEVAAYDPAGRGPNGFTTVFEEFEVTPGGLSKITEKRRDAFALVEGKTGIAKWEAGLRYETTDASIDDREAEERFDIDYALLLPSASVKLDLTARDRVTGSVARTTRRPRFDYISPALLEGELGENDLLGNPELEPETAWGVDFGYERRIGATGVAGVNVFHRWVSDLVEIANTGLEGSEGEGTFILQPRNSGDGRAWGIEFDLSASLGAFGLSNTGVFGNLALLDSEIDDFLGMRRFNGQPKYVYNLGFIQNLPAAGAAFGVTYRKQGTARDRLVGEEVRTTYGGELEVFVEKRLFGNMTIRAVGSNLLDGKKREYFNKFDTIEDQLNRDFDEYEVESEKSGPVFQLVGRLAF